MFCKLSVFRSFTKFIRKYPHQRLFLIKFHSSKLFIYALQVWGSKKIWLFERFSFRWLHLLIEWWIFLLKQKGLFLCLLPICSIALIGYHFIRARQCLFSLSYTSFCLLNLNKETSMWLRKTLDGNYIPFFWWWIFVITKKYKYLQFFSFWLFFVSLLNKLK